MYSCFVPASPNILIHSIPTPNHSTLRITVQPCLVVYHTLCSTYCFNVFLFCDVKYDRGIFNLDGYPSLHLISCYDVVWCSELHVNYSIDLQHTCSYIITDVISKVRELPTLVRELPQIADRNWLRPRESSSSSQNPNCFQDLLRQLCHKET